MRINRITSDQNFRAKFSPEVRELLKDKGSEIVRNLGTDSMEFGKFQRMVCAMKKYCPESTLELEKTQRYPTSYIYKCDDSDIMDRRLGRIIAKFNLPIPYYSIVLKDAYSDQYREEVAHSYSKDELFSYKFPHNFVTAKKIMKQAHSEGYGSKKKQENTEQVIKPVIDRLIDGKNS